MPTPILLRNHFRLPDQFTVSWTVAGTLSTEPGFFRCDETVCYGRSSCGYHSAKAGDQLYNVRQHVRIEREEVSLPFDAAEIIENLRLERYARGGSSGLRRLIRSAASNLYYLVRPAMPVSIRKHLQRASHRGWREIAFPVWPVDTTVDVLLRKLVGMNIEACEVDELPFIWFWPDGYEACVAVTHDIETATGRDFCSRLMDIDDAHGIKSSFQVVPELRYEVAQEFIDSIRQRGFEVNVHDLNHDGKLYRSEKDFRKRAKKINAYGRQFDALGFRAGAMYRNVDWYDALELTYDMSLPNVAHLDPQRGGCCTVMPFFIGNILELPLTMTQDYMLFHILNDYSLDLWKAEIERVLEHYGLMSFIVHPDYIIEAPERTLYELLLQYLRQVGAEHKMWFARPGEVSAWWHLRSQLTLTRKENGWIVEGEGKERARIAKARLRGKEVVYELDPPMAGPRSVQ